VSPTTVSSSWQSAMVLYPRTSNSGNATLLENLKRTSSIDFKLDCARRSKEDYSPNPNGCLNAESFFQL
jgi:hypothetical protein